MNLQELSTYVAGEFEKRYGRAPKWIVAAPGRVNIIGEHIDYNDGFVLPMAIEYYSVMAADRPLDGSNVITIASTLESEVATIDLTAPLSPIAPKWGNYPRGVVAGFIHKGINPGGLDVLLHSTVPLGSGLSSSAALEVSTATLLEAVTGVTLDPVEKALVCQKAEHDFAGVPCGIMDQFISALGREGHLLLLDCRTRTTELVPMSDPSVALLIINTNVKHELSGGEYAERRGQCEEAARDLGVDSLRDVTFEQLEEGKSKMIETVYRRARHVIGEIERTVDAADGIRKSSWLNVGQLMYASHNALRDDYEVSCKELDVIVEIAETIGEAGGIYGCRMTGGGFGGCCVALVKANQVDDISAKISAAYSTKTGIEATIFASRPAAGATILKA
jgi:galactokinase